MWHEVLSDVIPLRRHHGGIGLRHQRTSIWTFSAGRTLLTYTTQRVRLTYPWNVTVCCVPSPRPATEVRRSTQPDGRVIRDLNHLCCVYVGKSSGRWVNINYVIMRGEMYGSKVNICIYRRMLFCRLIFQFLTIFISNSHLL